MTWPATFAAASGYASTKTMKAKEAEVAVFLVPARTDTAWFHDHALKASEIRFFRGRLKFAEKHISPRDGSDAAPFPSMLVIYRRKESPNESS